MTSPQLETTEGSVEGMPDVFILGQGIYLRSPLEKDLDGNWYAWLNDPDVTYFQDKGYFPNTREKQRQYYQSIRNSDSDAVLAIIDTKSGRHIGGVGLHDINWLHRTAVLGIMIGEKDFWGKGYGKQAWRLITQYGFETLNLNKICATMLGGNEASLACALASGYQVEGTQREQMFKHGQYHDLIHVGLISDDWFRNNSQSIDP